MTRSVHAFFRLAYVQIHSLKGLNFFKKTGILRLMPNSVKSMRIHAVPICFSETIRQLTKQTRKEYRYEKSQSNDRNHAVRSSACCRILHDSMQGRQKTPDTSTTTTKPNPGNDTRKTPTPQPTPALSLLKRTGDLLRIPLL